MKHPHNKIPDNSMPTPLASSREPSAASPVSTSPASPTEPSKTSQDEADIQSKAKKSARSALYGSLFMLVVLGANIAYVVLSGQLKTTLDALHDLKVVWLWICCGVLVLYLLSGTLAYVVSALLDKKGKEGILDLMSVEAAGTFYGNLTPMMVGSLPAQLWRLIKAGLSFGEASAIQITRFSLYQAAQVFVALVLLGISWSTFAEHYPALIWLNLLLVVLKLVQLLVLIAIAFFPNWVAKVTSAVFNFVRKHHISFLEKHVSVWEANVTKELGQFKKAFRTVFAKPRSLVMILLVSIVQVCLLYITPWIVMKAFSVEADFWEVFTAGTMVQFAASSIPLPGGTGGIEAAFIAYFSRFLGAVTVPVYLVWRLLTFYGYTVITGIASNVYTKPTSPTLEERITKLKGRSTSPN